jgi:hypothetical protein
MLKFLTDPEVRATLRECGAYYALLGFVLAALVARILGV